MEVLSLTVYLSLALAALFVVAFVRMATRPESGCVEHEALLPLQTDRQITDRPNPWDQSRSHECSENNH